MIGYLAGPIARCDDSEAHDWRNAVIDKLPEIDWNNPMDRDFRHYNGKLPPGINNNTEERTMTDDVIRTIVEGDKSAIDESDICVFNVWQFSAGTMMELIYAWEQDKRNVVILNPELSRSPWITYHSEAVFFSLDDAIDYIRNM